MIAWKRDLSSGDDDPEMRESSVREQGSVIALYIYIYLYIYKIPLHLLIIHQFKTEPPNERGGKKTKVAKGGIIFFSLPNLLSNCVLEKKGV